MKNKRNILFVVIVMMGLTAAAAPRTKEQMKQIAAKAINVQRAQKRMAPKQAAELQTLKTAEGYEIIGLENMGFAVVSTDDVAPEVLGVSMSKFSDTNTNFQWWLRAINEVVQKAAQNNVTLTPIAPDPSKYPTQVLPLISTLWDQLTPYNNLCPTTSGGRCYTGCVATAMAQVLNFHKSPEHGFGQRTIYYPQNDTSGEAVTADFENHYYDWDNMRDTYLSGYSDEEANAVAVLMRDCGVAADMQYGGYAEGGSGAYSQDAAAGLRTYFGFTEAQCLERDGYWSGTGYTDAEWMDIVFTELSEERPLYYGGSDGWQGGHAFVIHGYNAQGMVYVNWGWSGDDDGYFDISLLNPSGYQFSSGQDMIIGVQGTPRDLVEKDIDLEQAGTLATKLDMDSIGNIGVLKISGDINSTDLLALRKLAGVDEYCVKTDGHMHTLDLSDARIVEGGKAYLIDGSKQLTTSDDILPERAFYGCKQLKNLTLPAGLKSWGNGALALCPQLSEIEVGALAEGADFVIEDGIVWNPEKTEVVEVFPNTSGEFSIPKGTVALREYAMAGCARLTKVLIPSSISTIGREAFRATTGMQEIRVSSKEGPTLTGADVFADMNYYSCKLRVPSGTKTKYAQKAQWKLFKGDGYDNIVEFGSSVKVRNVIRYYGEENPTLTYVVDGDPITGTPELSCEATKESPAGRYPITISAGTITDEMVELFDGYLVVQKVVATATVDNATREVGQPNPEFTLSFEGLVNDELVPVWVKEPVFACEADETSPEGEYPITVESGSAESYKLTFVAGTLTVTVPSGIEDVEISTTKQVAVYNINGQRLNDDALNSYKGVVIKDGKKYVKK